MFVAVLVVLLQWPDRTLHQRLVTGFSLAGQIEDSGVMRPIAAKTVGTAEAQTEELFGADAATFVQQLEQRLRSKPANPLPWVLTMKEVQAGITEAPVSKAVMDRKYGVGLWRPLPRHVIEQNGKHRPIDDGKAAGTNARSTVQEANVCLPSEFIILTTKALAQRLQHQDATPEWFSVRAAVEDWWKGYRQLQPTAEHMALCIAAIRNPHSGEVQYAQLKGLPFGLGAAVNQFVRVPFLLTAAARRLLYVLVGHYVDDNAVVERGLLGEAARDAYVHFVQQLIGVHLSAEKRQPASTLCCFFGHLHDLRPVPFEFCAVLEPKPGMRSEVSGLCQQAVQQGLTTGAAAKLRDKATWLDSGLAGRCCRGALSSLADVQYGRNPDSKATSTKQCAAMAPPRTVPLLANPSAPVLVYTDASADHVRVRIGALVLHPGGKAFGMVYDVPEKVAQPWRGEGAGINQAELYAANVLAWSAPQLLAGADVIWFIDNTAAESALVKSGSATPSMSSLALQDSTFLLALRARPWFEWVPSDDNPADGFSRVGWDCTLASQLQIERIQPTAPPAVDNFVGIWQLVETLG